MKKLPLHTRIMLGLAAGIIFGLLCIFLKIPVVFTVNYIKPAGTIFVNLLKLIAMPLIFASLIVGVTNLGDITKLSKIGGRTILLFITTTIFAATIGLVLANLINPGRLITLDTRQEILDLYSGEVNQTTGVARQVLEQGPLDSLVKIVPVNIFGSAADNANMLQIVFFAILFGIALLKIPPGKSKPVIAFFDGVNDVILAIIHFIMMLAPFGVFALIASLIVEIAGDNPSKAWEILSALMLYGFTIILGLVVHAGIVYFSLLKFLAKKSFAIFLRGIREAQLLAFSTSSSAATLPVNMECVQKNLGVSEEVSSFVLPLGATINMDGTCLYQSVAAVFIAEAMGLELSIASQVMIVLTATLASIGAAGVPGAGMVMLIIVLESAGIPAAGLALIVAPDRILDMCRTVLNVTGDATVAVVVDSRLNGGKAEPLNR
ncbi:MAG TPA: dicarboxylate/amino acid:cation symporter [Cyclobacteriaceae bacterium]|nr:dicarboxylate/amino acid:cation symporter [Cyclobacteriaceae bacterium]